MRGGGALLLFGCGFTSFWTATGKRPWNISTGEILNTRSARSPCQPHFTVTLLLFDRVVMVPCCRRIRGSP